MSGTRGEEDWDLTVAIETCCSRPQRIDSIGKVLGTRTRRSGRQQYPVWIFALASLTTSATAGCTKEEQKPSAAAQTGDSTAPQRSDSKAPRGKKSATETDELAIIEELDARFAAAPLFFEVEYIHRKYRLKCSETPSEGMIRLDLAQSTYEETQLFLFSSGRVVGVRVQDAVGDEPPEGFHSEEERIAYWRESAPSDIRIYLDQEEAPQLVWRAPQYDEKTSQFVEDPAPKSQVASSKTKTWLIETSKLVLKACADFPNTAEVLDRRTSRVTSGPKLEWAAEMLRSTETLER